MSNPAGVGIALLLLALNFLFVGAEFALISARRTQIEPLARADSRTARITLGAMENVSLMLAGAQLGITVCTLGLGAIGEPAIAHLLEPVFELLRVPQSAVYPISFAVALFIVVSLHVVIGEMVPKNIALAKPERAALLLGPPLMVIVTVLRPLIWLLNKMANLTLRALGVTPRDEVASTFTSDQVAGLVEESRRGGLIAADSFQLVSGALTFSRRTVESVVLPRAGLVSVPLGATLADIEDLCARTGYSRFPVTNPGAGGADPNADLDVIGYLHVKDVLELNPQRRLQPFNPKWIRPMASLRCHTGLGEALRLMQRHGAHLAKVVNDDGSLVGVVALEDVLEELVGEVRDVAQQVNPQAS